MKYVVASAENTMRHAAIEKLEKRVNKLVEEGYSPHGNLQMSIRKITVGDYDKERTLYVLAQPLLKQ